MPTKSKAQFRGTGQVFRFTFLELIKSRATIVSLLITLLFAVGALPVMTLVSGGSSGVKQKIDVYLDNRTGTELPELEDALREAAAPAEISLRSGALPEEAEAALGLILDENDETVTLTVTWKDAELGMSDAVYAIGSAVYDAAGRARLKELGFGDGEIALVSKGVAPWGISYEEFSAPATEFPGFGDDEDDFDESRFGLQIGYSVVLMMFCLYSVGYVVRAVIEEKQSKLVDLLMVSVRPAALLLGKVLSTLLFVLIYMLVLFGGILASYAVSSRFLDLSAAPGAVAALLNMHPDADSLIVILVTGLLGCLAFGLLGGLCGAGCSGMEESGGAMSVCTLLVMFGYMISLFVPLADGAALHVVCVLPVLSMFTAPLQYMAGRIGIGTVALSWVFQIGCIFFLIRLSAQVYSSLIMYNGKRLGFGKILSMAGGRKEERK